MASVSLDRTYSVPAQQCYDALNKLLPELGYEVWKTRPLAYLVMAKGPYEGKQVDINCMCGMLTPTKVTITVAGTDLADEQSRAASAAILDSLSTKLG